RRLAAPGRPGHRDPPPHPTRVPRLYRPPAGRVRLRGCRVSGPSPRVFDRRRPHGSRPAATAPHPPALNPAPRSPGTAPPRGAGRPAVRRHLVGLGTAVTSAGCPVTGAGGGERCTGRPAVGHPGRPLACPAVSGGGDVSGGSADLL